MNKDELVEEIWDALNNEWELINWDQIQDVVTEALTGWDESELLDEAKRYDIDVSNYKGEAVSYTHLTLPTNREV